MAARNKNIVILNNVQENSSALEDPHLLSVILRNLVSNSIKFMSADGAGKVTLDVNETNEDVQIRVIDNGQGMDEEQQKNVFKAFKPGSRGTDGEKGTGLGLSICKGLAEKQGGYIRFESTLGEGTTFIVHMQKMLN